jgi:hypothetical protein
MPLYEALGMPSSLINMVEADVAFGGDVLTSAAPLSWALLRGSNEIGVAGDPFEPGKIERVGDVIGATYDRHTRLGCRVLSKMLRGHKPWIDFFRRHPAAQPMECIKRALFYAEGGVLRPRLTYDRSADLYWSVLGAKFASTRIKSLEEGGLELLSLVQEALPLINDIRRKALGA